MDRPNKEAVDAELMRRVAQGDCEALETIYDSYAAQVNGLAWRILGERVSAENTTQETFWRLWQHAARYDSSRASLRTWLLTIARRLAYDTLRRQQRRPQEVMSHDELHTKPADNNLDTIIIHRMQATQIHAAIQQLPEQQKQIIQLAYFNGLTRREIAAKLGCPEGTVHTRARLALQKLRIALAEFS